MKREMTSRERLWVVLNHQEPDRVPIWMLYPRERLPYYVDVHSLPSYARVMPYVWEKTDWLDRRTIPAPPLYTAAAEVETRVEVKGDRTITRRVLRTPLGDLTSEHWQDEENATGATTEFYCKDIADLGADGIQPIEEPPIGDCALAEAKRRIGDRVCLVGSVQYDDFQRLTPDEMEELVKRQIGDAALGGGMILAPIAFGSSRILPVPSPAEERGSFPLTKT